MLLKRHLHPTPEASRQGNVGGKGEGGGRKSYGTKGCKEEEEAVAVIAGVLREKFEPQIVREELEEWGSGTGSSKDEEGVGKVKKEEEGDDEEEEKEEEEEEEDGEEAEAEASEEDAPPTTSPPTPPPLLNKRRAVSPASLLSLYCFFSSHLDISSPFTVASVLASHPALLRSNPTNDLLPRVRLLHSYGISQADIAFITEKGAAWLRVPLPQLQSTLEFLLAQGVRHSRLGSVLRRGRNLLCSEARSTNLDILVEKAGVPVVKLGFIIEICPSFLTRSKEAVNLQLETLSGYLKVEVGGKAETDSSSTGRLKQQLDESHMDTTSLLRRLIVSCPAVLSIAPYRIAEKIAILQSFTPPGTPSVASSVLRRAPNILNFSKETLLAKLQFLVELVGEEVTGRVARSYSAVLKHSKENLQGKVAILAALLGRENAMLAVKQFPSLLSSSEDVLKENFRELVREVEEVLEGNGEEGSGTLRLEEGEREGVPAVRWVQEAGSSGGGGIYARGGDVQGAAGRLRYLNVDYGAVEEQRY
ncbi:unnamed protein product, partial [Closterium sp. Naga37s-1]